MPRQLTKPEVLRRIAMRALLDSVPGMTHARLVTLCHASYTTVHDAATCSIKDWLAVLESAPDPSAKDRWPTPRRAAVPKRRIKLSAQQPPLPPRRPGDRRRARLVRPDAVDQVMPPDELSDVDIEPSDASM
ncbi:MAG: hypothetical protein JW839_01045 [Candidatus Lokiarchaeota archaeon]|nr:hypothetical protein [Candidatus Lokiarchaeota archaeon]